MKEKYRADLKCVFCGSDKFELPTKDYKPQEGEMIKCRNCGKMNDLSSIKSVAISNTQEEVINDFQAEIKKMFKTPRL